MHAVVHLLLHIWIPYGVARLTFAKTWKKAWLVMLATMVIDLDHLLADPVFDPQRCSIGFHPLHGYPACALYTLMAAVPKLRLAALGLGIHMGLDAADCCFNRAWF